MSIFLVFAVAQAAPATLPVVKDAPPQMLQAGYDQCLNAEVESLLTSELEPGAIFDESHQRCAVWLDAYFTKIQQSTIATNIDFDQEKRNLVAAVRAAATPVIAERQHAAKASQSEDGEGD